MKTATLDHIEESAVPAERTIYIAYLVYLVYLVYFVYFVYRKSVQLMGRRHRSAQHYSLIRRTEEPLDVGFWDRVHIPQNQN